MLKKTLLVIFLGLGISMNVQANMETKTQCFIFKSNKFVAKKSCTLIDYQTLGSAYAMDYNIQGYGKFEVAGSMDSHEINGKSAISQTRLRSNYKVVNVDFDQFSEKNHLSCIKQKSSGFEICS